MLDAQAFFFDLDDTLVDFGKARRKGLIALAGQLAARLPNQVARTSSANSSHASSRTARGAGTDMPQDGDFRGTRIQHLEPKCSPSSEPPTWPTQGN